MTDIGWWLRWVIEECERIDLREEVWNARAHKMDGPDGPVCMCGAPSGHESGWCGWCGSSSKLRDAAIAAGVQPDGCFAVAVDQPELDSPNFEPAGLKEFAARGFHRTGRIVEGSVVERMRYPKPPGET